MIKIIRNAQVYTPDFIGEKDVLIVGDKIATVDKNIEINTNGFIEVEEIDADGNFLVPGFIDCHVHILGGGGEGGFTTRTPEATLTSLTKSGVTTVVGTLGTDGVSRNMQSLLAKAHALEEEGITAYVYNGSYRLPIKTLTDSVMSDIMAIDKIIGIGEIAISDHRSSQPSFEEFTKIVSDIRVGGMLSGKAGIVNVHLGGGTRGIELITRTIEETEIPITQFLPTHINRNPYLFEEGIEFAKKGGVIDFTGSEDPKLWEDMYAEISFAKGLKRILEEGVGEDNYTLTSDGQGSLPMFDESGKYLGLGVGSSKSLIKSIKDAVFEEQLPLEKVIRAVTINPAKILKLHTKGRIEQNADADLCILDKELNIDTVIAKGKVMIRNKEVEVYGTFE